MYWAKAHGYDVWPDLVGIVSLFLLLIGAWQFLVWFRYKLWEYPSNSRIGKIVRGSGGRVTWISSGALFIAGAVLMAAAVYSFLSKNPTPAKTAPPTVIAQPAVVAPKAITEYVSNQDIGSTFIADPGPQPAIVYTGTLASIGNRLRIFVDILETPGFPFQYRRLNAGEIKDFVRGQNLRIAIATREDTPQNIWVFRWGTSDEKFRLDAGIFHARVTLLGDNGDEQHCYFMVIPWTINGQSYVHVLREYDLALNRQWETHDDKKN